MTSYGYYIKVTCSRQIGTDGPTTHGLYTNTTPAGLAALLRAFDRSDSVESFEVSRVLNVPELSTLAKLKESDFVLGKMK